MATPLGSPTPGPDGPGVAPRAAPAPSVGAGSTAPDNTTGAATVPDALDLFSGRDRFGARPRRFSSDIEDIGARLKELVDAPPRHVGRAVSPPVAEGVWGCVEHPHEQDPAIPFGLIEETYQGAHI